MKDEYEIQVALNFGEHEIDRLKRYVRMLDELKGIELKCRYFNDPLYGMGGEVGALCRDEAGREFTLIIHGLWVDAIDDAGEHVPELEDREILELVDEEIDEEYMAMQDAMDPFSNMDFP